ncbi:hypothetical protein DICPUDRAFT_148605 [Dictyostelium purpureum]|uniref:Uncharacterized protein n=1 Tax=Dictyostelium purpureum TaxID=5786 RepID=F0ZBJ7_DICPU|nr:uncharacterized protein DICPUDRAFT_148605 [Dictyostelium purpureum]EGC38707.1 hypothetical protein DICPUDRAFT_148605 [Dictyostelium purpureum]|eukprot:XP_003284803.1 hypothetical protein DICPUDRAFT_148605 [Dictyostelium purpureum]
MISRITFNNYKKISNNIKLISISNNNNIQIPSTYHNSNSKTKPTKEFLEYYNILNNDDCSTNINNRYYSTSKTESILKLLKKIIGGHFKTIDNSNSNNSNSNNSNNKSPETIDEELIEKTKAIAYRLYNLILTFVIYRIFYSTDPKFWEEYQLTEKKSILVDFVEVFNNPTFETHRVYGFIIDYLLKRNEEKEALYFFSKLKLQTNSNEHYYYSSFNTFITYYVQNHKNIEALNFFRDNIVLFRGYVESNYFLMFLQNWFQIIKAQFQQIKKTNTAVSASQHQHQQQQIIQEQYEKNLALLINEIVKIIKENNLLNRKVYENIIGSLIYTKQFKKGLQMYENEYKEYLLQEQQEQQEQLSSDNNNNNNKNGNNIKNSNNIYKNNNFENDLNYYLFQSFIISDNMAKCKSHFKEVIGKGGVIKPIVLYHLLSYSKDKDNKFFKELENYFFYRCISNRKSSALVLYLAKSFEDQFTFEAILKRLKRLIKGGGQEQKLALSVFDFTILLFLKGARYEEALKLYSMRLLDFGLAPDEHIVSYFMAYHIEHYDFQLYDYWAQLAKSFNIEITKERFLSDFNTYREYGLLENYNLAKFFLKLRVPKEEDPEYVKSLVPPNRALSQFNFRNNLWKRKPDSIDENIESSQLSLLLNELNFEDSAEDDGIHSKAEPLGSKLIDIVNKVKNTSDFRLFINQFYAPGTKFLKSIAFDPLIYNSFLSPTAQPKLIAFGLDLLYKEPQSIFNLPTTTMNIFNLFLGHQHLDIANRYFEKLILNHNIMHIDDIPTNRENYLKILISDRVMSTILEHLKQKKPLQVYISNILLKNLLINYTKTQIPLYEVLFLDALQKITHFNKETIIIYLDYLIKKKEKQNPSISDLELVKHVLDIDFVWDFYDRLKSVQDISSEIYDNQNSEVVDIEGNKNHTEPIQIRLPPKINVLQATNLLKKMDLLQPNQTILIIEALCQNTKYLKALAEYLKTSDYETKASVLKNLSQVSLRNLIATQGINSENTLFITEIFNIYHQVNKSKSYKRDLIMLIESINSPDISSILDNITLINEFIPIKFLKEPPVYDDMDNSFI